MNALRTTTLRPGLLVSLKTSVRGNVKYKREDVQRAQLTENGELLSAWNTERTVRDPEEHELALKVRSAARSLISAVCAKSSEFGLLCPDVEEDALTRAVAEARALARDFNARAKITTVGVYIMTGRIAPSDAEAVRSINSEVRDLLAEMEAGITNLDVKRVRDAADRAKALGSMLTPEAAARMQVAIDAVRSTARKIVKAGEEAGFEIDRSTLRKIGEARTAFLDLDGDDEAPTAAPVARARAIDLGVDEEERKAAPAPRGLALEL